MELQSKIDLHQLSSYYFDLPKELIAQKPIEPRDQSRLMVLNRASGEISHFLFKDLQHILSSGDSLVFNNTKVIPARLLGHKESGAKIETLLLKQLSGDTWEALTRPAKKLPVGSHIAFADDFSCEVIGTKEEGVRILKFFHPESFWEKLQLYGQMPLPHYIQRPEKEVKDKVDYQTVFAKEPGAVAAPTAGLHFTPSLLENLKQKGIDSTEITLHVGLGTFRPVQVDDIRQHPMHYEHCTVTEDAANKLNARKPDKRQVAVGTTCCRTLESLATHEGIIKPGAIDTNLFIYPGYSFRYTQSLLTNFHLPGSTLLMLVSTFAGYELAMEAYHKAIEEKYRFFSYGDAMLIL